MISSGSNGGNCVSSGLIGGSGLVGKGRTALGRSCSSPANQAPPDKLRMPSSKNENSRKEACCRVLFLHDSPLLKPLPLCQRIAPACLPVEARAVLSVLVSS